MLKKYTTSTKNMINNYIYDKIDADYLQLKHREQIVIIRYHLYNLCKLFVNDGFTISECNNDVIVFRFRMKKRQNQNMIGSI